MTQTIEQIEAEEKSLKEKLEQLAIEKQVLIDKEKEKLVDEVVGLITDSPYENIELHHLVGDKIGIKQSKTLKGSKSKSSRSFKVYVDPDNPENTYKTGPLPSWFKEGMINNNLDPSKKEDVSSFKKTLTQSV